MDVIEGDLYGQELKDRFLICRLLDKGSFGKVYKIVDRKNKTYPLVIKICENVKAFKKEIKAMRNIKMPKNENCCTPPVVDYGMFMHNDKM